MRLSSGIWSGLSRPSVVGTLWSGTAIVLSAREPCGQPSATLQKAGGLVTSCTKWRSIYRQAGAIGNLRARHGIPDLVIEGLWHGRYLSGKSVNLAWLSGRADTARADDQGSRARTDRFSRVKTLAAGARDLSCRKSDTCHVRYAHSGPMATVSRLRISSSIRRGCAVQGD